MKKCTCKYCQGIDYDNSEYFVDKAFLHKERPVGVTGLLRVKDDAEFLALCIDSCIDALDELVIVYQSCSDDSPQIIEEKRRQHPDKIKSYFYKPIIFSHKLSEEEFCYASSLPKESIHLLSNYYNYTLSKASFCYAMKIDADQIYFSDKLQAFCDAYRNGERKRITTGEYLASWQVYLFSTLVNVFPKLLSHRFQFLLPTEKQTEKYQQYTLKKIVNRKYPISFSGINLYQISETWALPLGNYADGLFPPFNGIHDTFVFKITPSSYYIPAPQAATPNNKYGNCIIERFSLNKTFVLYKNIYKREFLYGGFLWYHAAPLKASVFSTKKDNYKNRTLPLFEKQINFIKLNQLLLTPMRRWMQGWYCIFWNKEQNILPQQHLTEISRIIHNYPTDEKK